MTERDYAYLNGTPLAVFVTEDVPPPPAQDVTIDNDTAQTSSTGSWQSKNSGQATNNNYRLSDNNANTYRWTPTGLNNNTYEVYAKWIGNNQHNANTQYTISHKGQADNSVQNQKANGGQWNLLGTYMFSGNGSEYIEVSDSGGKTVADAIRLVEQGTVQPTSVVS